MNLLALSGDKMEARQPSVVKAVGCHVYVTNGTTGYLFRCAQLLTTVATLLRAHGTDGIVLCGESRHVCVAAKVEGLQAAGQAGVLLLPASSLFASADLLYLLPLGDKVHHERSNPLHRTALASCQHTEHTRTAAGPLASHNVSADSGNFSRATALSRRTHGSIGIGNGPRTFIGWCMCS